jgi:uncharacterized protein (DUF1800 family)
MRSTRLALMFSWLAVAALWAVPATVFAQDSIFPSPTNAAEVDGASFENGFFLSPSDNDAARFLNMATFGAKPADIAAVRSQTPAGWLDAQLNSPTTTLSRAWMEAYAASLASGSSVNQDHRLHRWFDVAVNAPDQVRQRVAWALSQIVITSDRDDFLSNEPIQMAEWNDIIVRNAFGNYKDLLREVTYSPMMGRYLTTLRNRKFELVRSGTAPNFTFSAGNSGVQPDENYAREVMQLFSIGLLIRGPDFYTTFPDVSNPGTLRNTYAEDDISILARVFTGLAYRCSQDTAIVGGVSISSGPCGANATVCTGIGCRFTNAGGLFGRDPPRDIVANSRGLLHPDWYRPMVCYPRYNDNGRDQSGAVLEDPDSTTFTLPPGSPPPNKALLLGTPGADIPLTIGPSSDNGAPLNCNATGTTLNATQQQQCIDYCEGNINSAIDFLFNHSNTPVMVARQLIQHLVTSNPSPEYVQRVATAFIGTGGADRGDMKNTIRAVLLDSEARRPPTDALQAVNFGKVREPLVKLVAIWRQFGAISGDTALFPATNPQGGAANPFVGQPYLRRWGPTNPQNEYQQRHYGAPSVFNFYEPDYRQPGPITTANLFSPEFQIIHEATSVSSANDLYSRICSGYGGGNNNCSGALTTPLPTDRAYFPAAQVDLIPAKMTAAGGAPIPGASPTVAEDTALIEFYNTRMMGGTMSGTIPGTVTCPNTTGTGMKGLLMNVLRCSGGINEAVTGGTQVDRQRRKALYLMHLIAISPEYSTQR